MDIAAIGSLLGSLKTATDIAKVIRESGNTLERAEFKLKLADLVEALADAKMEAAGVQQAILDRDELIRQLQEELKVRVNLKWEQPCYYLTNLDGAKEPYCQNCYDSSSKLARLHSDGRGHFGCRVCKQTFRTIEREESDDAEADRAIRGLGSTGDWMAR